MDLTGLSLTRLAQSIRDGSVTSTQAVVACIDRIERLDARINAVIAVDAEGALRAAREADLARDAGRLSGPLHGVPLAHKDMFHRRGSECGCGSKIRAGWIADATATVLARLDAAGAIQIARLTMSEFALGPIGLNEHFGHTRNPWDVERVSGGSSSGPAAAVAAGFCFGALGSDTGASIRVPAAACGVTGIKPTLGLVSRVNTMPLSSTLDVIGPIARSVDDAALLLSCIVGHDAADSSTLPIDSRFIDALIASTSRSDHPIAIGMPDGFFAEGLDPEIGARIAEASEVLQRLGCRLVPIDDSLFAEASALYATLLAVEATDVHREWISSRPQDYSPPVRARLQAAARVARADHTDALGTRARLIADAGRRLFDSVDVVLAPVWSQPIPTLSRMDRADSATMASIVASVLRPTSAVNVLGLPALALPCRPTGDGLPCGLQLIGAALSEPRLLALGRAYQRATDWHLRQPPLTPA